MDPVACPSADELLQILRIGHDTSMRGAGISLRDALSRAAYFDLRPRFMPSDLVPIIERHPELITQWIMYSEDKRTSGGYWLLGGESLELIAEYVVRELDYWSRIDAGRS